MKREFLQSLQVGDQPLPKDIIDAIMEKNGADIQQAKQASQQWEDKYNKAVQDHAQQLKSLRMENALQEAISKAGGKNVKAISALLDMETIAQSEDLSAALNQAVEQIKQECDYLFAGEPVPPFARFAGASGQEMPRSTSLAGALRERMQTHKI